MRHGNYHYLGLRSSWLRRCQSIICNVCHFRNLWRHLHSVAHSIYWTRFMPLNNSQRTFRILLPDRGRHVLCADVPLPRNWLLPPNPCYLLMVSSLGCHILFDSCMWISILGVFSLLPPNQLTDETEGSSVGVLNAKIRKGSWYQWKLVD